MLNNRLGKGGNVNNMGMGTVVKKRGTTRRGTKTSGMERD
jgi:hypothetical protein